MYVVWRSVRLLLSTLKPRQKTTIQHVKIEHFQKTEGTHIWLKLKPIRIHILCISSKHLIQNTDNYKLSLRTTSICNPNQSYANMTTDCKLSLISKITKLLLSDQLSVSEQNSYSQTCLKRPKWGWPKPGL